MYGNHPYGTRHKRDLAHKRRASSGQWRTSAPAGELRTTRVRNG